MTNFKHWRIDVDQDNILWLYIDKADSSANTLSVAVLEELEAVLNEVEKAKPRGMILLSGKKSGFIAGADVSEFPKLLADKNLATYLRRVHAMFDRIERFNFPTVAMIEGFCLGGGFELTLACKYRVAEESKKTKIGLPEVNLGIIPGWGGTVRMTRMIGGLKAMELMLAGQTLDGKRAQHKGLVDFAVPKRQLLRAAKQLVLDPPEKHEATTSESITNAMLARPLLASQMRKRVAERARKEHYPAPYALIDLWEDHGGDWRKMQYEEAEVFARLAHTNAAKNLVRVFFLQEQLKSQAKGTDFNPKHVHVIGAGVMGGDIAAWCALQGFTVTLQDREAKFIAPAIARAHELYEKRLREKRLITAAMDRLIPDTNGHGIKTADVIIEAIFENLEAKQALFQSLEENAKKTAVLATNTSSIPLEEISTAMKKPERLVGIHFFNPVAKMQLVEIVHSEVTAETEVQRATAFVGQISRLPLAVKSSPGFLVNRILTPYILEGATMVTEGIAPETVDEAAKKFGMPMGPIELADTVGLDICLSVGKILTKHYGGDIPAELERFVSSGRLGRKTGHGFYQYKNGKPVRTGDADDPSPDIIDRLVLRYVNESVACLREGVITEQDLLDGGMIFGTGFAPFRGGPIHYALAEGKDKIVARLESLAKRFGDRYKPDAGWKSIK